jgi:hypothetical protein
MKPRDRTFDEEGRVLDDDEWARGADELDIIIRGAAEEVGIIGGAELCEAAHIHVIQAQKANPQIE